MSEHNCQYIVDFHMEPGEDGDPIFCDCPAAIHHDGAWFCADHYDLVMDSFIVKTRVDGTVVSVGNLSIGVDLSIGKDATFSVLYGNPRQKRDF